MFSHTFPDDCPIRVRSKLDGSAPTRSSSMNRSSTKQRLMPLSLTKPWFLSSTAATAAAAAVPSTTTSNHNNNTSSISAHFSQRDGSAGKSNNQNTGATGILPSDGDRTNAIKDDVRPMPYHDYNPIVVRQVQSDQELPIHYWFYIYLYSSDVDRLLTPFVKLADSFGTDRRLTVIMNRCGVQIVLKELELYKSLPRRIVVIKAAQWTSIVKALLEMEERLPDLMRFATFPLLLDTDTTKYACTKFDRTACINRLTRPIH